MNDTDEKSGTKSKLVLNSKQSFDLIANDFQTFSFKDGKVRKMWGLYIGLGK